MATIQANNIPNFSVYGVPQMTYNVGGESGKCYMDAVTFVAVKQATAFEAECEAINMLVRMRMRKLEDLGEALAIISAAVSSMPKDDPESDDKVSDNDGKMGLQRAQELASRYGKDIDVVVLDFWLLGAHFVDVSIRRDDAMHAQNDLQYAMDSEDNELKQDMVTIQSFFSKRDNAYSTAVSLMNKVFNPAKSISGNM